jgi:uncharacterized protein (PEP-CTERM system associated)
MGGRGPSGGRRRGNKGLAGSAQIASRRDGGLAIAIAIAIVAGCSFPLAAHAQAWRVEAGVSTGATWTSNADVSGLTGEADGILDVRPHVRLRVDGAQIKLAGSAALSVVTYLKHTQPTRLEPDVDLVANVEAIQRLLFIDAGVRASQTSANPFGARPESGSTSDNSVTTTQVRVAPRIEGNAGSSLRYRIQSENTLTRESGATAEVAGADSSGYFGRHSVFLEQEPRPLGWRLEAERSETHYRDATQDAIVLDLGRATVDYALSNDFVIGVHGGREHTSFVTDGETGGNLYGMSVRWKPSGRTSLAALAEKRFFGSSWRLAFDHHTPRIAWTLSASRSIQTAPQSVFDLPASNNVAALLDALFTSRFPDPIERARIVDEVISRRGLPASTLAPISVRAQRLSLVNVVSVGATLIGSRNSLSFTAFQTRTEDLPDTLRFATGSALTNNIQRGVGAALSHRLSPTATLVGSADWTRIRALDGLGGERSTQRTARMQTSVALQSRTTVIGGARYRDLISNTIADGHEVAVFVGLDHAF